MRMLNQGGFDVRLDKQDSLIWRGGRFLEKEPRRWGKQAARMLLEAWKNDGQR